MRLTPEDPQYRAIVRDLRAEHPDPLNRVRVLTSLLQRDPDPILAALLVGTVEEYALWVNACQSGSILPSAQRVLRHETQQPSWLDIEPFLDPDLSEF